MAMTREMWIASFCEQLGIDAPSEDDIEILLSVAGSAAHASERSAAPIACWLMGRSGVDPSQALDLARRIEEAQSGST